MHLDGFLSGFKESLIPNNYEALVATLTTQVALQLEKVILKANFNRVSFARNNDPKKKKLSFFNTTVLVGQFASSAHCSWTRKCGH